jgi:hypothetical protein
MVGMTMIVALTRTVVPHNQVKLERRMEDTGSFLQESTFPTILEMPDPLMTAGIMCVNTKPAVGNISKAR